MAEFLMPEAEKKRQEQAGELEGPLCLVGTGVDCLKGNHRLCSQCLFVCWIFLCSFFPQAKDNIEWQNAQGIPGLKSTSLQVDLEPVLLR